MADFDFPATPSNGQQHTQNGQTWTWNGYAWIGGSSTQAAVPGSWIQLGRVDVTVPVLRVAMTGIVPTYSEYVLRIADLEMDVSTQQLGMQVSTDNGLNPSITGYQFYHSDWNSGATAAALTAYSSTSMNKTDKILVGGAAFLATSVPGSLDASVRFVAPGVGKNPKFNFDCAYVDPAGNLRGGAGYGGNYQLVNFNALIFAPWTTGNIRKGSFVLSGRVR